MGDIVIDANAGVHAKQVSKGAAGVPPIAALDLLCGAGVRLALTKKVQGEQIAASVSAHLERWEKQGWIRSEVVERTESKAIENRVGNLRPKPNAPDIALIALALRLGMPLYTHDGPAALWARACWLVVVDVIDVAAYVMHRGLASWPEIEVGHAGLGNRQGIPRPEDWAGTVQSTHLARPDRAALLADIDAILR